MYKIELFYGYEEGECGIYHAFEIADPEVNSDEDMQEQLANALELKSDSPSFTWDSMYLRLPDTLIARIKADAVKEYLAGKESQKNERR